MFQFNRIMQEIISSFNFIKHFAYTLCIFVRSIYMFSFSQSAFSQTSRYHLRLHASYFDEEMCIDIDSIQISGFWNLYLMCKLRLVIIKATPCSYLLRGRSLTFIEKHADIKRLMQQSHHHHRFKI